VKAYQRNIVNNINFMLKLRGQQSGESRVIMRGFALVAVSRSERKGKDMLKIASMELSKSDVRCWSRGGTSADEAEGLLDPGHGPLGVPVRE
jgi:hypothetical protein